MNCGYLPVVHWYIQGWPLRKFPSLPYVPVLTNVWLPCILWLLAKRVAPLKQPAKNKLSSTQLGPHPLLFVKYIISSSSSLSFLSPS